MEIHNDSNNVAYVEDDRQFAVQTGGRSGTPTLELPVINGNMVEVSCQFAADCASGGFTYSVMSSSSDAKKLTTRDATPQSASGWAACLRTDVFVVKLPDGSAQDDVTFEVVFEQLDGEVSAQVKSFLLSAKLVGSRLAL